MFLWKISITTLPPADEAVAELLESIFSEPASVYVRAATGKAVVSVYLARVSDWSTQTSDALRAGLRRMKSDGASIGSGRITARKIRQEDWAESWKRHFKPLEIGSRLLIKPSWSKRAAKKNQAVIILDPGLSFGTGQHPTTRFCLEQIACMPDAVAAPSFLDIGCGSGILAIAAAKLGYEPVLAIDSDPQAIRAARANTKANGVDRKLQLLCQDLTRLSRRPALKFDTVCANLIYDLLLQEKERIAGSLKSGGRLVLAGILRQQFAEVERAYRERGLQLAKRQTEKEWTSGLFVA